MGFFVNLTQIFFNSTICNGTYYLYKQTMEECFGDYSTCCNNFLEKNVSYNTCVNGTVTYCNSLNDPREDIGYIIQIFGILGITTLGAFLVYGFCRFVCYRNVENFDRSASSNKNQDRGSYEQI